ncbi:MAG: S8 family serine peptidase [Actinobacteria bacterium]|nr:S8 family serine peptidase [Actinomycetota bacterium]
MSATLAAPRITGRVAAVTILVAALAAPFASTTAPEPLGHTGPSARAEASVDPALSAALRDGPAGAIVQVEPAARAAAREAVAANGGTLGVDLGIVDGFAATLTASALDALRDVPGVLSVTLDGEVSLSHTPPLGEDNGDYFYDDVIRAADLHARGITGAGVGIAIIDTGVTPGEDLAGRVVGGVDISGQGPNDPDNDEYGHGTFVAGIAAGSGAASNGKFAGVAPGAHVVPVKIAAADGAANVSHVLAAIEWTVGHRETFDIGVLNLSLGTDSSQSRLLSPLNYAVERAWDSGIVVVVSAGNRGADGAGHIPKPADDPLVITVGATDSNGTKPTGDDTISPYSSRGPSMADGIVKPDIVAPGSHVVAAKAHASAVDLAFPEAHIRKDYMRASGTSFASAVTSGAVALLREAHPDWSPDQIKGAITASAAPGPVGDRNVDGHGILDVAAAADLVEPPLANQGVVRSTGLGTLADDRGSLATQITIDPILGTVVLLDGELTAQNTLWNGLEYTTSEWNGNQWYGNQWYGNQWYGNQWYGNQWYGNQWYTAGWE